MEYEICCERMLIMHQEKRMIFKGECLCFDNQEISYCPFCGQTIEVRKDYTT